MRVREPTAVSRSKPGALWRSPRAVGATVIVAVIPCLCLLAVLWPRSHVAYEKEVVLRPNSFQGNVYLQRIKLPPIIGSKSLTLEERIPVLNETGSTLELEELIASCGCASAVLEPAILAPGRSGALAIGVSLKPYGGRKTVRCVARFRDRREVMLDIDVVILPLIKLAHGVQCISLSASSTEPAYSGKATARIYHAERMEPPTIQNVACDPPDLLVSVDQVFHAVDLTCEVAYTGVNLTLRASNQTSPGAHSGTLKLVARSSGSARVVEAECPVVWYVTPPIHTEPAHIALSASPDNDTSASREIEVVSTDGQLFRILGIEAPKGIQVTCEDRDAASAVHRLRCSVDLSATFQVSEIVVMTNISSCPSVRCGVSLLAPTSPP